MSTAWSLFLIAAFFGAVMVFIGVAAYKVGDCDKVVKTFVARRDFLAMKIAAATSAVCVAAATGHVIITQVWPKLAANSVRYGASELDFIAGGIAGSVMATVLLIVIVVGFYGAYFVLAKWSAIDRRQALKDEVAEAAEFYD